MIKSPHWVVPILIAAALAGPAFSQTKEADQKYCTALADAYKNSHGQTHGMQMNSPQSLEVTKAMDGCKSGDTANAIPTLEKHLRELKVALPAR